MKTKDFIEKARKVHGFKYSYDKTKLENKDEKGRVCITCLNHGDFWQNPSNHLYGKGCKKCAGLGFANDEKIAKAKVIHGEKYDFSESDFSKVKKKTSVKCLKHGVFYSDYDHIVNLKQGCPTCCGNKKLTFEEYEKRANLKYNGRYIYHQDYIRMHDYVNITCPIHGDFKKEAQAHLIGQGCPQCSSSSILEDTLKKKLEENQIEYIYQVRTKYFQWLGLQSLDFYLPKYNIAIECQGCQHFGRGGWNKNFDFNIQFERDKMKYNKCKEHNVRILYYAKEQLKFDYIDKVYLNADELIDIIKENKI